MVPLINSVYLKQHAMKIYTLSLNSHTPLHISVKQILGYVALLACPSVNNIQHRNYTLCVCVCAAEAAIL